MYEFSQVEYTDIEDKTIKYKLLNEQHNKNSKNWKIIKLFSNMVLFLKMIIHLVQSMLIPYMLEQTSFLKMDMFNGLKHSQNGNKIILSIVNK